MVVRELKSSMLACTVVTTNEKQECTRFKMEGWL